MSRKSDLYNQLKGSGAELSRSFPDYTIDRLTEELEAAGIAPVVTGPEYSESYEPPEQTTPDPEQPQVRLPVAPQDPEEMPAQRLNTGGSDEPIRVDEEGRIWYQEEVQKPAYPKPRGRRVLQYVDTGVKTETVQNGEYVETFEVAGVGEGRPAQIKITLPSYQVGIFKDPRFPFRIHTYNGRQGFALTEVQDYWGGAEMVPPSVKRVYVENDLCYEIRSVVQAIQAEHRQMQLTGRLP